MKAAQDSWHAVEPEAAIGSQHKAPGVALGDDAQFEPPVIDALDGSLDQSWSPGRILTPITCVGPTQ